MQTTFWGPVTKVLFQSCPLMPDVKCNQAKKCPIISNTTRQNDLKELNVISKKFIETKKDINASTWRLMI